MSTRISKRIKFRDRPDWFMGRYFIFTLPYGLFYVIGAGVGYSRSGNLFCLLISGAIGILFLLLSAGHMIDYYRGANISSFYLAIPFSISVFVGIFMSCIWGLGGRFKTSIVVALAAWVAVVIYFYGLMKDYGNGRLERENTWYNPLRTDPLGGSGSGSGKREKIFDNAVDRSL